MLMMCKHMLVTHKYVLMMCKHMLMTCNAALACTPHTACRRCCCCWATFRCWRPHASACSHGAGRTRSCTGLLAYPPATSRTPSLHRCVQLRACFAVNACVPPLLLHSPLACAAACSFVHVLR